MVIQSNEKEIKNIIMRLCTLQVIITFLRKDLGQKFILYSICLLFI